MPTQTEIINGTAVQDTIEGTLLDETIVTFAGDDIINSYAGDDVIYGDFVDGNMLSGTQGASSFSQYAQTEAWSVTVDANGHTSMNQTVSTQVGSSYSISFELAANYGSGALTGAVEVLLDSVVIDSFDTNSALFSNHTVSFEGSGADSELTFRSIESTQENSLNIQTDAPIFYYETDMEIGGQSVTVNAFAPGQAGLYQVLNGTLHVFDPVTETYTQAGSDATVVVNAVGFNQEDDMLYGIAVKDGVDALGTQVSRTDLMMIDANGDSYRIGETPYASWVGDFDDSGNLWAFQSSMDRVTVIDVDNLDANGNPVTTTFKFPKDLITDQVWDVAFDGSTQTFYGVVKPDTNGENGQLLSIDVSGIASGAVPVFTLTDITGTMIDGVLHSGIPRMSFGAVILDGDGNLYAGGNSGDHDLNAATGASGGIYRVMTDPQTGAIYLELVSAAPRSYSNDGAVDPNSSDPFAPVDATASVLIRSVEMLPEAQADDSYDDTINSGAGHDRVYGGFGDDEIIGSSAGDILSGGAGSDILYGGAGPGWLDNGLQSIYDENGLRYDQYGNLLPEDDDHILGGDGDDSLSGSAGHDTLDGGAGSDSLSGGSGADTLYGGDGLDHLNGGGQNDILYGGAGQDQLIGGSGDDTLDGSAGQDELQGGSGNDVLTGGLGDDFLFGGTGADHLTGGFGNDYLNGGTGNDVVIDDFGSNEIYGGAGDDQLTGGANDDNIIGGSGADTLSGGAGSDTLKGGNGNDILSGGADNDKLYGGFGDDFIYAGSGRDYINAGSGDDYIDAGEGNDKIFSGAGSDIILGGAGSDWFVFRSEDLDGGIDTIMDFHRNNTQTDRLDFRLLGLLADGVTSAQWISENVTQNSDYNVTIDIGSGTVHLVDQYGLGADFLDQITDGLQL